MYTLNIHTEETLQSKINELNAWLDNHYPAHYMWKQKVQARNYYTTQMGVLMHTGQTHINA